ncbi:hypothetical protein AGOR_G00101190 [Albula goreensis]|uniref:Uncharacterized protein n=1 Tax=Albula goreensis TaxID=1534307 RepID=A0A8T3DFJ4_9TELE|nr:hypothetical protein AGOR_G00101190 [Albula goreensis]
MHFNVQRYYKHNIAYWGFSINWHSASFIKDHTVSLPRHTFQQVSQLRSCATIKIEGGVRESSTLSPSSVQKAKFSSPRRKRNGTFVLLSGPFPQTPPRSRSLVLKVSFSHKSRKD